MYYAGLLAAENDMALLAKTKVGRDINRPYLDEQAVSESLEKPVVKALIALIRLRNSLAALVGEFSVTQQENILRLNWQSDQSAAQLTVDFASLVASVTYSENGIEHHVDISVDSLAQSVTA